MYVPYNPFEPVDLPLLLEMQRMHKHLLVIQRFSWPGVASGKGFMVTPYNNEQEELAKQHAEKLVPTEGRLVDLKKESEKVISLINDPSYLLFVNNFSDGSWAEQMLKYYGKNIMSFVAANTNFRRKGIDIELAFEYGRLKAIIKSNGPKKEFDAYDLIR